jgi:hypothetical protein
MVPSVKSLKAFRKKGLSSMEDGAGGRREERVITMKGGKERG